MTIEELALLGALAFSFFAIKDGSNTTPTAPKEELTNPIQSVNSFSMEWEQVVSAVISEVSPPLLPVRLRHYRLLLRMLRSYATEYNEQLSEGARVTPYQAPLKRMPPLPDEI